MTTAQDRAEAALPVARAAATTYLSTLLDAGMPMSEVDPHQAFIDGFMTAVESLLSQGEHHDVDS